MLQSTSHKYGLLYQWGRKSPSQYSSAWTDGNGSHSAETVLQTTQSISSGISATAENSDKFYISGAHNPLNWLSPADHTRWNKGTENNPEKTTYDPCPDGWRVPTLLELTSLLGDNSAGRFVVGTGIYSGINGVIFNGSPSAVSGVFLPIAGYRSFADGTSYHRHATMGHYWSSKDDGGSTTPYRLETKDNNCKIVNSGGSHSNGGSIRCVKE